MRFFALTALLAATGCLADTRIRNNVPSPAEYMKNIRVTNGTFVAEGGAPYLVMLLFKKDVGYGLCGGTIIDPTTIITAGHCVYNRATSRTASPTDAYVFYGSVSAQNRNYAQATQIILHPKYNPRNYANDIAILKIPALAMAPGKVETINFYDGSLSPKQAFQVYGWGTTRTGDSSSTANSLLTQTVYVSNPSDCQVIESNYKDADGPQICANNHYNIGVDVCQGDSGTGTTVFSNKTPYYSGLVSYGTNAAGDATCGEDGSFGMYTNVYYYKSWIESATGLKYMSGPNSIPVTTTSPPEPKPTSCFLFFFFCG